MSQIAFFTRNGDMRDRRSRISRPKRGGAHPGYDPSLSAMRVPLVGANLVAFLVKSRYQFFGNAFRIGSKNARKHPNCQEYAMDLLADRGRRVSLEELNTSRLLAHARKQAVERNLDDILVVDVDSHHYENECFDEFLPLIENEVLRQLILAGRAKGRQTLTPSQVSFQDMGGRVTRYPMRGSEKTDGGKVRDVELGRR